MNTLIIDTFDNRQISIELSIGDKKFVKRQKVDTTKAQATLPLLMEIISENKLTLKDLDAIEVNTGPGSFTGLRVGIAIANALSFALNIPVNGKKAPNFAEPLYT